MRWKTRRRAIFVCGLFAFIFTAYSARLIELQVGKHDAYTALAAEKHSIRLIVPSRRGRIMDRNGEILAASVPVRKVIADGSHVKDAMRLATLASPALGVPVRDLVRDFEAAVRNRIKYKVILPEFPEDKALVLNAQLDKAGLKGLYFPEGSARVYPADSVLSHVVGFLGRKDPQDELVTGVDGIERSMNGVLAGEDGFRWIERDRTGREIVIYRGQEKAPRHGSDVTLTVDMGLQSILESELENTWRELRPVSVCGLIVRPKTGEILAMSNRPTFDLNKIGAAQPGDMRNRTVLDMVEPGSTFKIVAASAALDRSVVNEKSLIYCENGRFSYAGRILRDHHGYGHLTVHDILVKSSNIGSAKLGLMMGGDAFHEYVRRFGFGERSGIALPGEIPGLVHPPAKWDSLTITRMPMGHSVAVTPLQITMAMSVIANGGKLMRPQLIKSVSGDGGTQTFEPEVVREVVLEKVAKFIADALTGVVSEEGTAPLARVSGFRVAGKTGTAQKVDPRGGYAEGKYVVSFVGFMPAEDPEFVCLIMIDEPNVPPNLAYGGLVAAPVFSRVAERAARYLDIPPSPEPEPEHSLPVALSAPAGQKFRR